MPLRWTISHPKRLVVAVAKAEVRPRAMVDFLAALDAAGARPYGKLVLLERLVPTFSEDSVVALANLVRQREQESEVGRLPSSPRTTLPLNKPASSTMWPNLSDRFECSASGMKAGAGSMLSLLIAPTPRTERV
jgi:hypothetical protein